MFFFINHRIDEIGIVYNRTKMTKIKKIIFEVFDVPTGT